MFARRRPALGLNSPAREKAGVMTWLELKDLFRKQTIAAVDDDHCLVVTPAGHREAVRISCSALTEEIGFILHRARRWHHHARDRRREQGARSGRPRRRRPPDPMRDRASLQKLS